MRETITKVTGLVATCVCTVAMLLASVLVPQQHAAAADDTESGSFTSDGVNIPNYCGHNSVYVLTTTGEVYRAFLPSDQSKAITNSDSDVTGKDDDTLANATSAKCLIPMPYLPAQVAVRYTTAKRRAIAATIGSAKNVTGKYNALGADTSDGILWAAAEIDTSTVGKGMQVFRLDPKYRNQKTPNPDIRNLTNLSDTTALSSWERVGGFISLKNQTGQSYPNVFGGAVNPLNHYYYVANLVTSNTTTLSLEIRSFSSNGQVDSTKTITIQIPVTQKWTGSSTLRGDIEFDDDGNLTIVLSKYKGGASSGYPSVGITQISESELDSNTSITGTLTLHADPAYDYGNVPPTDSTRHEIDGIGYSGNDTSSMIVSMYGASGGSGDKGTSDAGLYSMNMSTANLATMMILPQSAPHTQKTPSWGTSADRVWTLAKGYELWGGGSTYTQSDKSHDWSRYYIHNFEVSDIAKGGSVGTKKPYSGSYQFTKVDATSGKALEGAKFTLWPNTSNTDCASQTAPTTTDSSKISLDSDGNPTGSEQATSESDGSVKFSNVPLGMADSTSSQTAKSFCLVETATSDSSAYELDSTPKSVVIQPSTVETVTTGSNVSNTRKTGSISWTKVDASDTGTKLGGSEWQVTYTPDATVTGATGSGYTKTVTDCVPSDCTVTSGNLRDEDTSEGSFKLSGLTWGTYTVTETKAPEGYELSSGESYTFYVGPTTLGGPYKGLNPGSNTFEDPRKSGTIAWGKYSTLSLTTGDWGEVDASNLPKTGLGGSVWKLTVYRGSSAEQTYTIADCVSGAGTCASLAEGSSTLYDTDSRTGLFSVTIPGSLWNKTIRLTEATAPTGYKTNTGHKDFTIDASHLTPKAVEIGDDMVNGPALPMAGGLSQQIFQWAAAGLIGLALLLATALWIKRKGGARVK